MAPKSISFWGDVMGDTVYPSGNSNPTELEKQAMNPHDLFDGDLVILPDGSTATICNAGFKWATFIDRPAMLLEKLRPYTQEEEGKAATEQLSLFPDEEK